MSQSWRTIQRSRVPPKRNRTGVGFRWRHAGRTARRWYSPCASGSVTSTRGVLGFSEGGREHRRIGEYPSRDAPFPGLEFASGAPGVPIGGGAGRQRSTRRPPVLGTRGFETCTTIPSRGRACHFSPLQGTAARPSSCLYSFECVEGLFSEVPIAPAQDL
jgi:hypothetical protein